MTRQKPLSVGAIAEITFLDHVEDSEGEGPLEFKVWGRVTGKTRKAYEITCWGYADNEKRHDGNEKDFQILRSTITRSRKLR